MSDEMKDGPLMGEQISIPGTDPPAPPQEMASPNPDKDELIMQLKEQLQGLLDKEAAREAKQKAEQEAKEDAEAKDKGGLDSLLADRKRAVEMERKALQEERKMNALERSATSAGLRNMDFLQMVDSTLVTISDSGTITGVSEAISALKEKHPGLFSDAPSAPLAGGSPAADPHRVRELTDEQKSFRDAMGWSAFGGKWKPPGAREISFEEAYLGEFKRRKMDN